MRDVKIFAGRMSKTLTEKVCMAYDGKNPNKLKLDRFKDGEFGINLEEKVRGSDAFVIQSTFPPAENHFELCVTGDALMRASAVQLIAVCPYLGNSRQDKKHKAHEAIVAKVIANQIKGSYYNRLVTIDLHAPQIEGFYDFPVDHLRAAYIFVPYLRQMEYNNLIIVSPDMGGSKRAEEYASALNCEMAICYKKRLEANKIGEMRLIGDVKGKNVIIVDDICDTAGTICRAADLMMESGAESVQAVTTHPLLSGSAYYNLGKSKLMNLITTDTIPLSLSWNKTIASKKGNLKSEQIDATTADMIATEEAGYSKVIVLSVADMIAQAIMNINEFKSMSKAFTY